MTFRTLVTSLRQRKLKQINYSEEIGAVSRLHLTMTWLIRVLNEQMRRTFKVEALTSGVKFGWKWRTKPILGVIFWTQAATMTSFVSENTEQQGKKQHACTLIRCENLILPLLLT